ncbi:MAG: histidine--tRNA ligase [Planctomycetota bacterium]
MSRIEARTLKGFRDYLPEAMIPKQAMLDRIARTFERHGFSPVTTPALEYTEVLTGNIGPEDQKLLYRFQDHGDRDVALRFDLTVPFARMIAEHGELPRPFRRYQMGTVWRGESPGKGRYREFMQCDVDIVGSESMLAEAEILAVGCAAIEGLGVDRFQLRLGHRKLLNALMTSLGVDSSDRVQIILRELDKLLKVGEEQVRKSLTENAGLQSDAIDRVFQFIRLGESSSDLIGDLEGLVGDQPDGPLGIAQLAELLAFAEAAGFRDRIVVDLSIARGLDYYTGAVYETFLLDLPDLGSVMSGGRYDGLIGLFLGQSIPAVGISVGIDRLVAGLQELGLVPERKTAARVLVVTFNAETATDALRVATSLRAAGIPTELFPGTTKLAKQFKYANRLGFPLVVVGGPDELAQGQVQLKDMEAGDQTNIAIADLPAEVSKRLAAMDLATGKA